MKVRCGACFREMLALYTVRDEAGKIRIWYACRGNADQVELRHQLRTVFVEPFDGPNLFQVQEENKQFTIEAKTCD